jgi:hypothetical protein
MNLFGRWIWMLRQEELDLEPIPYTLTKAGYDATSNANVGS